MADDIFFSSWENMKRMEFATKHLSQSSDSIVFLDIVQLSMFFSIAHVLLSIAENCKSISIFSIHQAGHVFFGPTGKVNKSRVRVKVLAWFSKSGAGEIRLIKENFSDEEFLAFLDDMLLPEAWARFGLDPVPLLINPSPRFNLNSNSSVVRDWQTNHPEFKLERFPPKSYDINPFQEIWRYIEGSLRLQRVQPKDAEELWEGIKEIWDYRSQRPLFWQGLVDQFRANLTSTITKKGN